MLATSPPLRQSTVTPIDSRFQRKVLLGSLRNQDWRRPRCHSSHDGPGLVIVVPAGRTLCGIDRHVAPDPVVRLPR
jgi:hypothetical protein